MGLMLINVEPEVDLSVDQLMDTPDEYEGETLRIHGTILTLDSANQTLVMEGENHTVIVDYSGASLPSMATESNELPGYHVLGRLFALGYLKGLMESVQKSASFVYDSSSNRSKTKTPEEKRFQAE